MKQCRNEDLAKVVKKFTFDKSNVKWVLDNNGSHSEFIGYDSKESQSKIMKWANEVDDFVVLDKTLSMQNLEDKLVIQAL